jgi:nitrite reductase/ring-hydroxylating ferredoxin subunit
MPRTKIAETKDLPPETGTIVEADGRPLALFNACGTFYAVGNTCLHRGGPWARASSTAPS